MTRHSNLCGQPAWRWAAMRAGRRFRDESGKAWEVAAAGTFLALAACSTVQSLGEIEHGLSVANRGDSRISNVVIQYGKITRRECVRGCPPKSEAGLWNAPMPIPDTMQVTWETSDGQKREVTVPVKSRIKDRYRLRTLYLEFSGGQLSVRQALHGLEELPLFP